MQFERTEEENQETKSLPYKGKFFVIYTLQVQNNNIKCIQIINIELHNIA